MRTYHSNDEKKTTKNNRRTIISIVASCAIIICAFAIAIPLILANNAKNKEPAPLPAGSMTSFVSPVDSYTTGMEFRIDELIYSSTLNQWRTHSGVDFIAETGTSVMAVADGTVTEVKSTILDGNVITITHDNGFVSVYKSLADSIPVSVGDKVSGGDKIGEVSTSMITEQAEGPHLHLELLKSGKLINPLDHIPTLSDK